MIVPPYVDRPRDVRPDGLRDEVLDHAYADVRVPVGYGSGEDASPARPLADSLGRRREGGVCSHRGSWDVLVAEEPERYGTGEDDDDEGLELPHGFRLVATCTACGLVAHLEGQRTPEPHARGPYYLAGESDELRARDVAGRELVAQRHSAYAGPIGAAWTVYRQRGDGRGWYVVGGLWAGKTRRGRAYVSARYGHPNSPRTEGLELVEAPTAAGALRKLAKLEPPTTVPVSRYVPGGAEDGYRGTWVYDRLPDPTTAEAAVERARQLAEELAARRARSAEVVELWPRDAPS